MAAVQFFGVKPVVDAYDKRGIECWAIFQGRELITAGDDSTSLREYLDMLAPGGSAAVYTLRFYRGAQADDIMPKTEYDSCFNFKLSQGGEGSVGVVRYAGGGGADPIMQKLHGMVAEEVGKVLEKRFSGEPEKEKKKTIGDFLMGLLEDPEELIGVIGAVKALFSPGGASALPMVLNGTTAPTRRAGTNPELPTMTQEEKMQRLFNAFTTLEQRDPDALVHLEKLAILAESKPGLFKTLISTLNDL